SLSVRRILTLAIILFSSLDVASAQPARGQPRGERADQVAQGRRLAEDRRGVEPGHSGGGMMIRGVALVAVLLVSLRAAPLGADAQQAGKVPRIGFLSLTSPSDRPFLLDAFRQRLRELGWVEGHNIVIDYRYAEGRVDRLPDLAAELVRLKVDLIVASAGTQASAAAQHATETIPIVMIYVRAQRAHREPRAPGRERHRGVRQRRPGTVRQTTGAAQGDRPQDPPCGHPLEPGQCVPPARDTRS